jgi:hypothetical protein
MPAKAFVIRFPSGDFEYDMTRRAVPLVGDQLRRRGLLWSVARITQDGIHTVHVERVVGPESRQRERDPGRLPLTSRGDVSVMTETPAEPTERENDEPHPLESEEALSEPRVIEDEHMHAPQPVLTPDPDDD